MKAITVWQPWASMIILGLKPFEYRHWYPPASLIGQRIVIHASARKPEKATKHLLAHDTAIAGSCGPTCEIAQVRLFLDRARSNPRLLPLAVGLGTAILGEPASADVLYNRVGLKIGSEGPWNIGWPMLEVHAWDEPIPCTGAQGFWNWPLPIGDDQ